MCVWAWCLLGGFWWSLPPARPRELEEDGSWLTTGRLIDEPDLHLGVRPHSDDPADVAITVQVTVRTPW